MSGFSAHLVDAYAGLEVTCSGTAAISCLWHVVVAKLTLSVWLVAPLASLCVGRQISMLGVVGVHEGHRNLRMLGILHHLPICEYLELYTCCNYCDAFCDP